MYKPLKLKPLWLFIGYFGVFFTIYICLSPNPPDTSGVEYGDKLVHFLGYVCLFLWFSQIYERTKHWRPAIGLFVLGVGIEIAQSYTGYRSFEIADMLANTSGVLFAWLISGTSIALLLQKFEAMFFDAQNV